MYLLYTDESGSPNSSYFVLGGIAVHEQTAGPLARSMDQLFSELPVACRLEELHTQQVRRGSGPWQVLAKSRRLQLLEDVARLLVAESTKPQPPVLFAVAFHRDSVPHQNPYERAYEEFFARCNGLLGRLTSQGDPHRCIVIADQSRRELESTIQSAMIGWREHGASTGAAIGPLASYAEVPLFVDSRASRLVQLADFVAHWVYRAYEVRDDSMLRKLVPCFDQEDGRLHGLVHLVRSYWTCDCLACGSRRPAGA